MSVCVRRLWLCCLGVSLALAASSCGGGGGGSTPSSNSPPSQPATGPVAQRPTTFSDLEIAQLVYAGSPRTPSGFYAETTPPSYSYVATTHLKNTDVESLADTAAQYELCTDDWNEALSWSEAAQQRAPQYADLVATDENSHYFEFGRTRNSEPEFYLRGRVFKCSYVERMTNNLRADEGTAGALKTTPIDADELRELSEYLWQFTRYNNFGHAVLSSSGESSTAGLQHTLLVASLERAGISSTCDLIDLVAWRHDVNTATGELTRSVATVWSLGAREVSGVVEECE